MSDYLDPNNEELLKDFFAEAEQQVDNLESNVLVIENDPTNHEAIDEIFRAAHTLKGGSATVEMNEISTFTHTVEDMLDEIRSDRLKVTEPVIEVLLNSIDVIKAMLEARSSGSIYQKNIDELMNRLHSYIPVKGEKKSKSKPSAVQQTSVTKPVETISVPVPDSFVPPVLTESEYTELKNACQNEQNLWCVSVKFDESNPMNSVGGIQVFAALKALGSVLKTVPDFDALYEDTFYTNVLYYLATNESQTKIEDTAFLNDVTLFTDAQLLDSYEKVVGAGKENHSVVSVQDDHIQSVPASEADKEPVPDTDETTEDSEVRVEESTLTGTEKTAEVKSLQNKQPAPAVAHAVQGGSLLRVDSRRIDYLLNLVSETVITKAAFNQLSMQLANELIQFQ
ncbi:MAG: Hpt domain-containing protein, partial [Treponema sp.]|nr:Hpt domain-containing protein [Treponema sp.]